MIAHPPPGGMFSALVLVLVLLASMAEGYVFNSGQFLQRPARHAPREAQATVSFARRRRRRRRRRRFGRLGLPAAVPWPQAFRSPVAPLRSRFLLLLTPIPPPPPSRPPSTAEAGPRWHCGLLHKASAGRQVGQRQRRRRRRGFQFEGKREAVGGSPGARAAHQRHGGGD